jgi:CheY-like chemotaxis protein
MRLLFEETGHRVTTAASIADTVAACTAGPVDLLLLDLGLADGDGLDVLARLTAPETVPRVRVALTGRDEPEIIERCLAAGCRAVLLKPVPARDLLRMTREWLDSADGS